MKVSLIAGFLLTVIACISAASTNGKNEQNGRFFQYKVKPRSGKDVQVLLEKPDGYGDHPPVFLKSVLVGENVNILMDQSKTSFFESRLRANKISFLPRGLTLVESITARDPPRPLAGDTPATCDCNYSNGGCKISTAAPSGFTCKCVYNRFWSCSGVAVPCNPGQPCPVNCTTLQCCQTTGGNCNGYPKTNTTATNN